MGALSNLSSGSSVNNDMQYFVWRLVYRALCNWIRSNDPTESLWIGDVQYSIVINGLGDLEISVNGRKTTEQEFVNTMVDRSTRVTEFYPIFTLVCRSMWYHISDTYEDLVETLQMISCPVQIGWATIYYASDVKQVQVTVGEGKGIITDYCVPIQMAVVLGKHYGIWNNYTASGEDFLSRANMYSIYNTMVRLRNEYKTDEYGVTMVCNDNLLPEVNARGLSSSIPFCVKTYDMADTRVIRVSTDNDEFVGAIAFHSGGSIKVVTPKIDSFVESLGWSMSTLPSR